ncbi:opioid growth factor receptor [Sardina pilchardus]|uniref:opioid growth factor receptor n=1 Tax=Sardina pilchardus TaxID=27697 RepID=UPI002E0DB14E
MEDDLVCEYDSTWDTESDGDDFGENTTRRSSQDKTKKPKTGFWSNSSSRNLRAAKDMQNYRHGYPNINDDECPEERMTNLKFYLNEIPSSPDDVSIEMFHKEWKTDYKRLERVHSYIQWLFPLREPGVNYMASELTKKEIQAFRESKEARDRLVDSYELMLGFYGIQLTDKTRGEVKRADNWRERFANLERNMHNNLRITRILKSLGELGFEHFQPHLVHFFLEETLVRKNLSSVKRSVLDYFVFAVRDKRERKKLLRYAYQHYEPKDKFVWCPRKVQKLFKKKSEKRQELAAGNGESAVVDEGRSKGKAKDTEPGREGKPMEDAPDTQSQMEEDNSMSVDAERPSEGSLAESVPDKSLSGSPLANGIKNSSENGEMEQSSSSDASPAKDKESKDDELKDSGQLKEAPTETSKSKLDSQEVSASEPELEKPPKKKRESETVASDNGVTPEPPSSPCQSKSPSEPADSQPNQGAQCLGEASPAKRVGRTVDERAEKQPRTDFSSTPNETDNGETTSKVSVAPATHTSDKEPEVSHQTNGADLRNSEEPMDVEVSGTADVQSS